jgi:hypothetical protein
VESVTKIRTPGGMGLGQAERQIAVRRPREFAASSIGIHTPFLQIKEWQRKKKN